MGAPSTWVVGDVHGWSRVFDSLLARLDLDADRDHLWLVGDLVNRGPDSLGMLRRARDLERRFGDRFVCVLGNHDLHLLATAERLRRPNRWLRAVLDADDADALLDWLRRRPLLHVDRRHPGRRDEPTVLVHAGLWPEWTIAVAEERAREIEELLRAGDRSLLRTRHGFDQSGDPATRRRARDLHAFVSLRMVRADGTPSAHKGAPEDAPAGDRPWYALDERAWRADVLFGHWAALGHRSGAYWTGLDGGCSWGRDLVALRLEDRQVLRQANPDGPAD